MVNIFASVRNFVKSVKHAERLAEEERGFEDLVTNPSHPTSSSRVDGERKTLASLRTIESQGGVAGTCTIVPSVRTGNAINCELSF